MLAALTVLFCLTVGQAASPQGPVAAGVVVEDVARYSAGEAAGIQVGDVIGSWAHAAATDSKSAGGRILHPFDLSQIEVEEGPLGSLRLAGFRAGVARSWRMPPGQVIGDWR